MSVFIRTTVLISLMLPLTALATDLKQIVDTYNSKKTMKELLLANPAEGDRFVKDLSKEAMTRGHEELPKLKLEDDMIIFKDFPDAKLQIQTVKKEIILHFKSASVTITNDMTLPEAVEKMNSILPQKRTTSNLLDLLIPSAHAQIISLAPVGELIVRGSKGLAAMAKSAWTLKDRTIKANATSATRCLELEKMPGISEEEMKKFIKTTDEIAAEDFICNPKDLLYDLNACKNHEVAMSCRLRFKEKMADVNQSDRSITRDDTPVQKPGNKQTGVNKQ